MDTAQKPDRVHGQDAYQRLMGEIRDGRLKPGDRLTETELAARLGISRTPVREAIRQLEADGLVSHQPRVGATVRKLDYSEITELYQMRTVLEGTAAAFAARAASGIELDELEAINGEMEKAETSELYTLNRQFHRALLNAAKNRFLTRAVDSLQKTLLILGRSTLEEGNRRDEAAREHAEILTALRSHDAAKAEAAMRRHIELAHAVRLRQFRSSDPD